jgi:preprotein translocase subunit YajC
MIMIRVGEADKKRGGGDGQQLHDYWTKSAEGLAKWASSPHPWTALHSHLVKHMKNPDMAARVTSAWYHDVFGVWPGTKQKKGKGKATRPVTKKEAILLALAEAATHPGPYQWSHGWKPLTPRARAIKAHKIDGSARGKKHPKGKTGGGLPKPGHVGPVGVKKPGGDDKPPMAAPPKKITMIVGKPIAKQPAKPAAAKKPAALKPGDKVVTAGGNTATITSAPKDSIAGPMVKVKYDNESLSPGGMATLAVSDLTPAPKLKVKVGANTNTHGVDTSKIKAGDVIETQYGEKGKVITPVDADGFVEFDDDDSGISYASLGTITSLMPAGPKSAKKPTKMVTLPKVPAAKPALVAPAPMAKPGGTINAHGVDTSKVKAGDHIITAAGGQKVYVTHTDDKKVYGKNEYGASIGVYKSQVAAMDNNANNKKPHNPAGPAIGDTVAYGPWDEKGQVKGFTKDGKIKVYNSFYKKTSEIDPSDVNSIPFKAAPKAAPKPKSAVGDKGKKAHIPFTNSPHDDHPFKLPGGYQYGSEGFREVVPANDLPLTAGERSGIMKYTGSAYSEINNQLRHDIGNFHNTTIKNLDSAFAKVPPLETGVRVRRLAGDEDTLFGPVGSKVGGTFSDKGYVSTTYYHNPEDAGSFSGADITIDMPPGTVALAPDGAGEFKDAEGEVMLPRDTKFRVKGDYVDEGTGQRKIHLEVIV